MNIKKKLLKGTKIFLIVVGSFFLLSLFFPEFKSYSNQMRNEIDNIKEKIRMELNNDIQAETILKVCRKENNSLEQIECIESFISAIQPKENNSDFYNYSFALQNGLNCMGYYNARSDFYKNMNNLHLLPNTLGCGYQAHRIGIVYSCSPENHSEPTYFCLVNNKKIEWCGKW